MRIASTDLETCGINEKTCDLLEFGLVLEDTNNPLPLEKLPFFHRYILPRDGKTYRGEPMALSFHGEIFKKIATYSAKSDYICIPPERLGQELARFFSENGVSGKITPAGKNFGSFDLPFLLEVPEFQKYVGLERGDTTATVTLAKRSLDPAMFFFDPAKDTLLPDTKTCLERANIKAVSKHTAVEDAILVIQLLREGIRQRIR
jgi:hypothetical protein